MKNLGTIESVSDFLNKTEGVHYHGREETRFFCRGQGSLKFKLRPKIGRYKYAVPHDERSRTSSLYNFEKMFAQFEREYITHHDVILSRKIDKMTLAQHYGLATPLLDWSLNPLVALYFVCVSRPTEDGIVFIFSPHVQPTIETDSDLDKGNFWQTFRPKRLDQRMINQDTVFTYHPKPTEDFGDVLGDACNGVIVPCKSKFFIRNELASIGFHKSFAFPGLSSICERIDDAYKKSCDYNEKWEQDIGLEDEREPYLLDERKK